MMKGCASVEGRIEWKQTFLDDYEDDSNESIFAAGGIVVRAGFAAGAMHECASD